MSEKNNDDKRGGKEHVKYWYDIYLKYKESGLQKTVFCKKNNIVLKLFTNKLFRIEYKKYTSPELYKKLFEIGLESFDTTENLYDICDRHNIPFSQLSEIRTHIRWNRVIEELKKEDNSNMKFIEIPSKSIPIEPTPITKEPETKTEALKKQNDIEIIINQGVKVLLSPQIDSTKIIKIIEFLKDL